MLTPTYFILPIHSLIIPPSHRRPAATAVLVRHKPQWHRHDRRGSAVVPSLIAVTPPKTVKTAQTFAVAWRKLLTCSKHPRVRPIRSGVAEKQPWSPLHRTRTAVAPPSPPCPRSSTSITAVPSQYNRCAIAKI